MGKNTQEPSWSENQAMFLKKTCSNSSRSALHDING